MKRRCVFACDVFMAVSSEIGLVRVSGLSCIQKLVPHGGGDAGTGGGDERHEAWRELERLDALESLGNADEALDVVDRRRRVGSQLDCRRHALLAEHVIIR